MKIKAVDLFCGAGGLTRGLANVGIDVRMGIDIDSACKYPYEFNNDATFLKEDVTTLTSETISAYLTGNDVRLIAGCAPCQPFSSYTRGKIDYGKEKWGLLNAFSRIVKDVRPELVSMENVAQLKKHAVFQKFKKTLEDLGYHVWFDQVNCHHYGVPQTRRRLVLLASLLGPIEIIKPTHLEKNSWQTVRNTIEGLAHLYAGDKDPKDPLHVASVLSSTNLKRIKASKPGGTWRDWPKSLVARCHKKKSGKTYSGVYGRMRWDAPSPTMTTQCYGFGNGRFGHPKQDRAISLREAAMLQTFPKDYQFIPPGSKPNFKTVGRLIGNAVPVRLGEIIGLSIIKHLEAVSSSKDRKKKRAA
ncbi:MAG: DNA cytosine methyltransferase [Rhodospirillales bacterium]|nr:DNA cytosine methyltransferase [Rhodospirillales bacterium]